MTRYYTLFSDFAHRRELERAAALTWWRGLDESAKRAAAVGYRENWTYEMVNTSTSAIVDRYRNRNND